VHHEDCAALNDPEADLRLCMDRVRMSSELPHNHAVRGFVYTRSGALREIHTHIHPETRLEIRLEEGRTPP
jgi:carbonic anhydrase